MSLGRFPLSKDELTEFGAMLFLRRVSGIRSVPVERTAFSLGPDKVSGLEGVASLQDAGSLQPKVA